MKPQVILIGCLVVIMCMATILALSPEAPAWVAKNCRTVACVTDTLNDLLSHQARSAKVTTIDGEIVVWYRETRRER